MLAIAGGKGGCGKTTTALGIARALADIGARPLVVDTDADMPDVHHRAGVDGDGGVAVVAEGGRPRTAARRSPRFPGVDVLPCRDGDAEAVAAVAHRLADAARPVLLDCPAGAGPAAVAPLRAADRTVVVSTPSPQSLRDAAKTAAMARELDAAPALVVLVRSDGESDPSPLFESPAVVHIPELSEPPLETEESVAGYLSCAKILRKRNI
ncbi:MinD/ParA family ATP-binding protein [Haloarcula marina]|uniref:MinD/ParA family ATP-binding protein n=1 Tax=Haloarcula marina TaxID=2961574 RepID=UPI0024E167EA|nr:AAA family ATPase [Halomicroarcula marina]